MVKSQDQSIRRERLIARNKEGRLGRLEKRPIGNGGLAFCHLSDAALAVDDFIPLREPRHLCISASGTIYVTEINRLLEISFDGDILNEFTHELFSFLHTININGDHALVTSSGFDSVIEINLKNGDETYLWNAWENGFNPDLDGVWLTLDTNKYRGYLSDGKNACLINPSDYGELGLLTARRTAHPNYAVNSPYEKNVIYIGIAHDGCIVKVNTKTKKNSIINLDVGPMSHGLYPLDGGWCLTNTMRGEWFTFTKDFQVKKKYSFSNMEKLHPEIGDIEWVQQVSPVCKNIFIALDANRGLIIFDIKKEIFSNIAIDPEWCVQDCMFIKN